MTPEEKAQLFFEVEKFGLPQRPTFWNLADYFEELIHPDSWNYIKIEGDDVGFVLYRLMDDAIDVFQWAVKNKGSGFAKKFFDGFLAELKVRHPNANKLILEVHEDNLRAQSFYKKVGFQKINIRKNYYRDSKAALILERSLGPL